MTEPIHALVIAAHPDDAEFGAAGTVAVWTSEGRRVVYVVCTSGEKGTNDRAVAPADLARAREQEQRDAAAVLGVAEVIHLRYPDQGLEDTTGFRKELVREIRRWRPHIVVTSDPYRRYLWHRDHRVVGQVVLDAVFPFARDHLAYPDLLEAGLEPHKVAEVWCFGAEDVNHRVDVTATFERKVEALLQHRSQVAAMGIPDLPGRLRRFCREMAAGSEFELAEAYHRVVAPP
ncbi:MAG: PIG-L family deacetylase [Deferrisomatales bacterium]|nr:PIG-L family deacetylase [Deferrisomatales bacterium]